MIFKKSKKIFISFLITLLTLTNFSITHAYELTDSAFPPSIKGKLKYYIYNAASGYNIGTYTEKWNNNYGINLSPGDMASANIKIDMDPIDNGAYGISYLDSILYKRIIFYKPFIDTSTAYRNETIVHEVGHTLGLHHTQKENNEISVMRSHGFNNKAYPLSDDLNGIKYLYY